MPEAIQFKTSQNLLNPNEHASTKQNDSNNPTKINEKDSSLQPAGLDIFASHHVEKSCAAIVDNSGYNKAYTSAISLLGNVATNFMRNLAMKSQKCTEHSENEETTVENVLMAMGDSGCSSTDLLRYMKSNNPYTVPALPLFPVSDASIPSKLSENAQKNLCQEFNSIAIGTASINTANIFDELHNDKRPFDFDAWKLSAAELKLLTMPPIRHETSDDMANAVKSPSYWKKRDQNMKYENNYNWADKECSSDSEISLIDSVVLSPRPADDSTPPIKLRDAIEMAYLNPSESIIQKNDMKPAAKTTSKKNITKAAPKISKGPKGGVQNKDPVAKAASNIDLQPKRSRQQPSTTLTKAKSSTNFTFPVLNIPQLPRPEKIPSKTALLNAIEFSNIGGQLSDPSTSEDENDEIQSVSGKTAPPTKKRKLNAKGGSVNTAVSTFTNSAPKLARKIPTRQNSVAESPTQPLRRSSRKRVTPERYAHEKIATPSSSQISTRTAIEFSQSTVSTRRRTAANNNNNQTSESYSITPSCSNSKTTTSSIVDVGADAVNKTPQLGLKMILRRAPTVPAAATKSEYKVVFCSSKTSDKDN
uniref:Uncharacterized protein n=1 Tax=Panagrolaimus sp. PS1159 TaxID=55785 RepID=A0AC35GUS9_9BILA